MITPSTKLDWTNTLGSFAAVCAQYTGHISNWAHILPSMEKAKAAFASLPADMQASLVNRASKHGLEGYELMQKIPEVLWDRFTQLSKWLEMMDISHIKATSVAPELANHSSNWTWEVSGTNRARKAVEMTSGEFREANETTKTIAEDMTGTDPWWDINDMFHGFLETATVLGYTGAYLPKSYWLQMMNRIKRLIADMRSTTTFGEKVKVARAFALDVKNAFFEHKHVMAAAFSMGFLTLLWGPAQFFVSMWAMSGLLGTAIHVIRGLLLKSARKHRGLAGLLMTFNTTLKVVEVFCNKVRNFLDKIKDGVMHAVTKMYDILLSNSHIWTKALKPAVQAIIKTAKNVITGFFNWIGSFFKTPSFA